LSPWEKLLEEPNRGSHYVQLYTADEAALISNVGRYLWDGLRLGEGVLVIATPEHQDAFSRRLRESGADLDHLARTRQLVFLDAQKTLDIFMERGQPDWIEFEKVVRLAMRLLEVKPGRGCRAYGEMVGILWKAQQFAAAIRLEQLWNKLLEQASFSLYCAYEIDVFSRGQDLSNLDDVLCTHTHLVPAQTNGALEAALNRAMDDVLGSHADELRMRIKSNPRHGGAVIPTAENIVLWLRRNLPDRAGEILELAQQHYSQ